MGKIITQIEKQQLRSSCQVILSVIKLSGIVLKYFTSG